MEETFTSQKTVVDNLREKTMIIFTSLFLSKDLKLIVIFFKLLLHLWVFRLFQWNLLISHVL